MNWASLKFSSSSSLPAAKRSRISCATRSGASSGNMSSLKGTMAPPCSAKAKLKAAPPSAAAPTVSASTLWEPSADGVSCAACIRSFRIASGSSAAAKPLGGGSAWRSRSRSSTAAMAEPASRSSICSRSAGSPGRDTKLPQPLAFDDHTERTTERWPAPPPSTEARSVSAMEPLSKEEMDFDSHSVSGTIFRSCSSILLSASSVESSPP
mmetsp:Transcript_8597/g.24010  ORF Transcript_8597/g.24010 Transcript_8597/m.24010 type:complete len:210 (+) Transcript_8597:858-1487(+)